MLVTSNPTCAQDVPGILFNRHIETVPEAIAQRSEIRVYPVTVLRELGMTCAP
jgi:hypothetical protein